MTVDLGYCENCQRSLTEADDLKPSLEVQAEARKRSRGRARLARQYNGLIRRGAQAVDLAALQGEIDGIEGRLTELGL
jgi:hypothetical protein